MWGEGRDPRGSSAPLLGAFNRFPKIPEIIQTKEGDDKDKRRESVMPEWQLSVTQDFRSVLCKKPVSQEIQGAKGFASCHGISKCFSLKYKLALSIWNWNNLGWKIFSSSKLGSIPFAIFSYGRQLCVCVFLYGNLLLLLAQGWLVRFCHWDVDTKAGEQKWASIFFLVSIPTVCSQDAALCFGPTCRLTSPTPLTLVQRFSH